MAFCPSAYDKKVASFLKKSRGSQSYREFAPKLGLTRSVLHRLENQEQSITLAKLDQIAKKLKVPLIKILTD